MNIDPNMDLDAAVPKESKYLQQSDVGEIGKNLTIASFTRDNVDPQGTDIKTVVHFAEPVKPFILNQTNKNRLKHLGYIKVSDAIGQTINVYADPTVEFGGEMVGGLRIRADQRKELLNQQHQQAEQARQDAEPNDEIPF